jgi:general secretion pathway protein I
MTGTLRRSAEAGFTLLETLVALAILGIVMSTVYGLIGSGLRSAHRDEDRLLLALVAQNLLARSRYDLNPRRGELSGDIGGGLRWRIASVPYAVPDDILPEPTTDPDTLQLPPAEGETSTAAAADGFGGGSEAGGFGDRRAAPQDGAAEDGDRDRDSAREQSEQRPRRPPVQLRLVTVVVEKGDQRYQLSTLAMDPPPVNPRAR